MRRIVTEELLDTLPATDPRAQRSRQDLRRVNAWMGNARHMASSLAEPIRRQPPCRLVDLGAGDGAFLFALAERWPARAAPPAEVLLVDRHAVGSPAIAAMLSAVGWRARFAQAEAISWLETSRSAEETWLVANLFLHHFHSPDLRRLFAAAAAKASLFCACEPRRGRWPLLASRLLGCIGANGVTRHDAVASVRAGFRGRELSELWPGGQDWRLRENAAGLFSHLFLAQRAASAGA